MITAPGETRACVRRRYAETIAQAVDVPCTLLARRLGTEKARAAIVPAAIAAARGLPAEVAATAAGCVKQEVFRLHDDLTRVFASLPEGDPDLAGFLIAEVAERTLPASARASSGIVYTDAGMVGFALDEGVSALGRIPGRLLDPACGAGAFLAEAVLRFGRHGTAFCGMDRDADAIATARARLSLLVPSGLPISLRARDALRRIGNPRFDLVVGNPPYLRQEELGGERFKRALAARLECALPGAGAALGRKADLSVAFLLLGLARLRPGGVLAYVTGNAWLDALYGVPLRKFLAERAEVRRIVEWEGKAFTQAAANPVVVVIRRSEESKRRPALFTRYALRAAGEGRPGTAAPAWVGRHRRVGIRRLASEPRWGAALLRRIDLLDEVYRSARDAFAPLHEIAALHYGTKPGLVDFFVVNGADSGIEKEFLIPILASTSEISSLEVRPGSLPRRLFVCPVPRARILTDRFPGARAHVMRGECARTRKKARHTRAGLLYPEVPSVRGNAPWYHLRPRPAGDFAIPLLIRERYMIVYAPERVAATNMFYQGRFSDRTLALPGTAVLNSSVSLLALESLGRINIGGRINVYGPEIRPLRVPNPRRMKASTLHEIAVRFGPLRARPVGTVSEEIGRSDRRALDAAVLDGAGVPSRYLPLLAEALEERVARRLAREVPGNPPLAGERAFL